MFEFAANAEWRGLPCRSFSHSAWSFWIYGQLYEQSRLLDELPPTGALSEAWINEAVRQMNGHFLVLAWQAEQKAWHVWTNRFGTLHAYHTSNGKRAAIGTFSPAVAAAASNRELDGSGLAGFFAFGFFPQDQTHYRDLRIIPPATHSVFNEQGHLSMQERYWDWWHTPKEHRSYDDTVAEFARIFQEVMAVHLSHRRIAIPISGGLDSRSTVAAVRADQGSDYWSYSYGYERKSIETKIARQVAAARNIPFSAFEIRPYLFEDIQALSAWTEGFADITLPRQASVLDELSSRADWVLAGLWGDVWLDTSSSGGEMASAVSKQELAGIALKKMQKRGRNWLFDNLIANFSGGIQVQELLAEGVQAELAAIDPSIEPDFRLKAFKTDQWSFRWSLTSMRVFQSAVMPRFVFYDRRLTDFFCTVPASFLVGRRLQIDFLKRYARDLAKITWQVYDANLFNYQHFDTWQLPKRAVKKAWRLLSRSPNYSRNWELQFLSPEGVRGLDRWLMQPGLRLHDLTSRSAIQALLTDFFANPRDPASGYTVSMLLTFSAWLELYG